MLEDAVAAAKAGGAAAEALDLSKQKASEIITRLKALEA